VNTQQNPTPDQKATDERFFKLKEVQDRFGISRATLWRWSAERGLPVVSVGGVTRIRESDLQAFVQRHLKTTGPATN
jgi:excisionase family DNA binding protein